jgi:hypothetical protein
MPEAPTEIQTAQDKMAGEFENLLRLVRAMAEVATELAALRKTMFDAYVAAGFTQEQALLLCQKVTL